MSTKVEDIIHSIELDPNKRVHNSMDVLVAVAKVVRDRSFEEKFNECSTPKATDNDRSHNLHQEVKKKTSVSELSCHQEHDKPKLVTEKRLRVKRRGKSTSKKEKGTKLDDPILPPDMPVEFEKRILEKGGTEVKFVIEKVLTYSDCEKAQNRLFISNREAADFLRESEKEWLENRDDDGELQSINVALLQPNLKETYITLRQYNLKKKKGNGSRQYVLNKPWYDVVRRCGLAEKSAIHLWSFRVDGALEFAMVKLPKGGQERVDAGTNA